MLLMKLNKIGNNIVDVMSSINFVTIGLMHVSKYVNRLCSITFFKVKKNNKKSTFFSNHKKNYNRNRLETFANYRLNKYQFLA